MNRIQFLVEQHLKDNLSLEEKLELEAWVSASEENQVFFNELTDPEAMRMALTRMGHFNRNRVWEKFQVGIKQDDNEFERVGNVHFLHRKWFKYVAVAAVLIGISFGTYFLIQKPVKPLPIVSVATDKSDILPGNNKAILTLGNGSKIILDSAGNGAISVQGNSEVIKSDSGKLVYNLSAEKSVEIVFNTLSTPRGGQHQLTLSDGTKVWLNAASSITYPTAFIGSERKVVLTGEAYFEVVHNQKVPFRVQVGDQTIEDLGTSFNINAYPDEKSINTTLLEGSVKIIEGKLDQLLKPGEQARVSGQKIKIEKNIDLDQVVAWKNGSFNFQNVKLEAAMRQISRWYDIDVVYEKGIPNIEFGGEITRNIKLATLLHFLEGSDVHFRIEEGKKLIILP